MSSFLQSETNVFCNGIWKCTWNVFLFADLYWFLHNGSLAIKTKTKTKTKQQKRVYTFRGVAANLFTSLYYKMICRILLLWSLSDKNIDKGEQKLTSTTTKQPERCLFNQKKKKKSTLKDTFLSIWLWIFLFGIQGRVNTFTSFHLASMWWSIFFHAWHFYEYMYVLVTLQELQDGIGRQQTVVKTLNVTGEEIIEQSSAADANVLKEQLGNLNTRWQEICRQLVEKRKR